MSGWASETLLATSLLILVVLALRVPVARLFGAKAAYLLWLAPLLRLVWPPVEAPMEVPLPIIIETVAGGSAGLAGAAPAGGDLGGILLIYWLGGAALFLAGQLYGYRRFLRQALTGATPVGEAGIDHAAVLETDRVSGPCATGLLVRRIFVPRGFAEAFGTEERRLALAHEALHHRRGDLWASAAALVVLALLWWNPLAYLAHRAFRLDMEAACDADLVREAGEDRRVTYAETLLRCVARPMPQPTCALTNLSELKGRLTMLSLRHGAARRRAGITIASLLTAGALAVAAPVTAQQPAAPTPPAPSVAPAPPAPTVAPTPPTPPTPPAHARKGEQRIERIVIRDLKPGTTNVEERLPADVRARIANCEGQRFEFNERAAPQGPEARTRILLCANGGKAEAAAAMERALAKIQGDSNLPAETKARVVAQLQARIAELKSGS